MALLKMKIKLVKKGACCFQRIIQNFAGALSGRNKNSYKK
jgi:hypothetical protein